MSSPRIPILTWHSMDVAGADYATNKHEGFRADLETIHRMGFKVVPVRRIAEALVEQRLHELDGCVGLTFDDAPDFDFHDLPHPTWGAQRGMLRILEDFVALHGADAQPALHATSFAIVSPEARRELDRTCMVGCGWWNHDWWPRAEATGLLSIESHSWDHNHDSLEATVAGVPPGHFDLRTREGADAEIAQASEVLKALRGRAGSVLLAYPYGEASEYLVSEYLPRQLANDGVYAAFSTVPTYVTPATSRWEIPRHVAGWHWKSPDELAGILASCRTEASRVSPVPARAQTRRATWRDHFQTWEINDARRVAGELFRRRFGHEIPGYPRHFVLVYSPPAGGGAPSVVAYVHQLQLDDVYLCGGMCVDEGAYRRLPKWLFAQVREAGGLATIVTRDSMGMLGDSLASFGHVGEPRARAADLRTGFVDTGRPHLMVMWLKDLAEAEKLRLIDKIEAHGPF